MHAGGGSDGRRFGRGVLLCAGARCGPLPEQYSVDCRLQAEVLTCGGMSVRCRDTAKPFGEALSPQLASCCSQPASHTRVHASPQCVIRMA